MNKMQERIFLVYNSATPQNNEQYLYLHIRQHLRLETELLYHFNRQRVGGVDVVEGAKAFSLFVVEVAQQQESTEAEEGVENVCHVARPVADAALVLVLALADEVHQLVAVDPRSL